MRAKRIGSLALTLALLLILGTPGLWAAENGGENPVNTFTGTLFRWLNFALVFGAAAYLIGQKGPAFFRGRSEVLSSEITAATARKREAHEQLRLAQERRARLAEEAASLRAAAQREALVEAERIWALTRDEVAKIERAARLEIATAERAANMELRKLAARLAVERAERVIRERMNTATRQRLFETFVEDLSRRVN